jgi:hypothetical protein
MTSCTIISSRMENSGAIDNNVSKPTAGKMIRSRRLLPPSLLSFLKSLRPLKKLSSRDLSDATASTVASDFSNYKEEYQGIFPGEVQGAHVVVSDQWDCCEHQDCCSSSSSHGEYDTTSDHDDYRVPLSDAPTRNRLLDETRTSPKRREMLMDDFNFFERKILEERLNVDDRSACADSTTDEEYGEEGYGYEVPRRLTSTRNRLLDEASRNPRKLELLMDDFEWRSHDKWLIHLGGGEIVVGSDVEDDEDSSSCSQTEDEFLYE